jgi:hypothetical protein
MGNAISFIVAILLWFSAFCGLATKFPEFVLQWTWVTFALFFVATLVVMIVALIKTDVSEKDLNGLLIGGSLIGAIVAFVIAVNAAEAAIASPFQELTARSEPLLNPQLPFLGTRITGKVLPITKEKTVDVDLLFAMPAEMRPKSASEVTTVVWTESSEADSGVTYRTQGGGSMPGKRETIHFRFVDVSNKQIVHQQWVTATDPPPETTRSGGRISVKAGEIETMFSRVYKTNWQSGVK